VEEKSFFFSTGKTKDIAAGIVITSFMLAAFAYLPVVGTLISFSIPIPVLFYRSKLGRKDGIIIPLSAMALVLVFSKEISVDTLFIMDLLLLGFVLSELMELKLSIEKTIGFACSIVFFSCLLCLLLYGNISGKNIFTATSDFVAKNLELSMALYESMDIPEKHLYIISNAMKNIEYVLVRMLPALLIILNIFISWACILLVKPVLKGKGLFYPDFGQLKHWKAPDFLVWCVIASCLLLLWPDKTIKIIGLNAIFILMTIFFFEGIAIVAYYFEKKAVPRTVRFFLYTLIALQQIVLIIVIGLGFFDVWFDFRKLGAHNEKV